MGVAAVISAKVFLLPGFHDYTIAVLAESKTRFFAAAVVLTTVVLVVVALVMAWHAFPLLGDDSSCFVPVAINLKNGLGLVNPTDIHAYLTDPLASMSLGHARFLYYPPMFEAVLALLMGKGTVMAAYHALGLLGAGALIATACLLWRRVKTQRPPDGWAVLGVLFSLPGLMSYLLTGTNGRPEVLTMIWVCGWAGILFFMDNRRPVLKDLALLGVLSLQMCTQPISAVLGGIGVALYLFRVWEPKKALFHTIMVAFGCVALFLMFLALSPGGLSVHLSAMRSEAHQIMGLGGFEQAYFVRMYLTGPHFTGYGLILVAAFAAMLLRIFDDAPPPGRRWVSVGLVLVLLAALQYFVFQFAARNYNIFALMPLLFLGNLDLLMTWPSRLGGDWQKPVRGLVLLATAITGIGFVRKLLMFGFFLAYGVSLPQAQLDFQHVLPQAHGPVYFTDSLWVLSDDNRNMRFWADRVHSPPKGTGMLVVQNNVFPSATPPVVSGYKLIFSSFSTRRPTLFGHSLALYMPGYGFAAYVPQ